MSPSVLRTTNGPWSLPLVVGAILRAEQGRLGTPEIAPRLRARQDPAALDDAPEEVVRRQEQRGARRVAVLLDDVVLVVGHVLRVAREDDEVVERGQVARRTDRGEILLRRGSRPSGRARAIQIGTGS